MAPWQWAEHHRILPPESAEAGRMRTERAPWTRPITEAISNPRYREIICIMGSQTSKTDGVQLNTIGWQLHYRHKPILFYGPTEKNAKAISDRVKKMITLCPELYDGLDKAHDNVFEKFIFGTRLGFGWAGSKTEVASHPAEIVLADEIDRYREIPGEGSSWQLMRVRISTYPGGKQVGTTSPTVGIFSEYRHSETGLFHIDLQADPDDKSGNEGLSLSGHLFNKGTRQEYMVPCPHCGQYFAPKSKLLWWPEDSTVDEIERNASIRCPHCAALIPQFQQHTLIDRGRMIAPGQWIDEAGLLCGKVEENRVASFHVNGLCSRWRTWGERAIALNHALKSQNQGMIRAVLNTEFGEWYSEEQGTSIDWESLLTRRIDDWVMGVVPDEVQTLTCFVDVQLTRLIYTICGWSQREGEIEMHLIECGSLEGNTFYGEVWRLLEQLLSRDFNGRKIRVCGIDAGFNPSKSKSARIHQKMNEDTYQPRNIVYEFVRNNRFRVVMTKGSSRPLLKPFQRSLVDVQQTGRVKKGLDLWILDTDYFKTQVMMKLTWIEGQPGQWYYPVNTPAEFFKQLTAEFKNSEGIWITKGDNHFLDCMTGNLFLAEWLGLRKSLQGQPKARAKKRIRESEWDN